MKTIGVLTSGGDAPGMNAAIRAVVRTGIYSGMRVVGIRRGYNGLINGEVESMDASSVGEIIHRGGTILHTARCEEFKTQEGLKRAANVIDVFNIDGIVVIGGDGSYRGAQALNSMGIATVGVPGTIDNDIAFTDLTIGFDTAVNTVLDAVNKLRDTVMSHERANIVEVMGRTSGRIALYSGLAGGAENILVPEMRFDMDELCQRLIIAKNRGKKSNIIIAAEGVGNTFKIGEAIEDKTGIETRVTVLGHIQRGGSPTATDRVLASKMGAYAIKLLAEGVKGRAVCLQEGKIVDFGFDEVLCATKPFDQELYELTGILSI
jgi:6-phosphofructokinase 1